MTKFKVGDIVRHKSTGDSLFILRIVDEETTYCKPSVPVSYTVRLPSYNIAQLQEIELDFISEDKK